MVQIGAVIYSKLHSKSRQIHHCTLPNPYRAIDDIVESYKHYAMLDINITLFKYEDPRMLLKINSKLIPKQLQFVSDCNPFITT